MSLSNKALQFQIIDIDHFHEEDSEGGKTFKIRLFGKTVNNKSVYVQVGGFTPYFFVQIDNNWRHSHITKIMEYVKSKVWPKGCVDGFIKYEIVEKCDFYGFTNYKKFNFLKLIFSDYDSMMKYSYIFRWKKHYIDFVSRGKNGIKFKIYESNITPILRFLHERNINAVGWVEINQKNLKKFKYENPALTDISYKTNWEYVHPVDDNNIHSFEILSFDLECKSCDGGFPQPHRPDDNIIQIGMTYSKLGNTECFRKIILCLKYTSPIEGVDVRCFDTEKELLMEFTKVIIETDPDVITGYNIFGFDFKYLYERAILLGIESKFSILSRLNNHMCKYELKELKSAALGDNILKYYHMPGRIVVDLMKVVQRDYKLAGYKLDYVASHFIRDKISSYLNIDNTCKLYVSSIFGIKKDQYISIYYNDGITDTNIGDKKYKILDLGIGDDNEAFAIIDDNLDFQIYLDKKYKVYWCQAKDDVTPKQIFACYSGTPEDRSIVGKYCIQDCELCNRLIDKLQILTNNIGMANVCHVPLSYLFLRGQGIKIFSLVSRQCRLENHLIPVIKKKKKKTDEEILEEKKKNNDFENFSDSLSKKNNDSDEEDSDDEGYEGATVFDPIKGVHYNPIAVLDFASLYPNSMILQNLSHETHVEKDGEYDNLPGYKYNNITYYVPTKEIDKITGEEIKKEKICRFAEKLDKSKGIIPRILMELLSARKKYKRMMADENKRGNKFKASILDGMQLAYKVTANSLYGQTGASTSQIYKKEIAASTTATGRDMLQYAKYFIEDIFGTILKYSIKGRKKDLKTYMKKIFKDIPEENINNIKNGYTNKKEFYKWCYSRSRNLLKGYTVDPKIIYGDTDSVFFDLNIIDKKTGEKMTNQTALELSITLGLFSSDIVNILMPYPMNLEYEKVLWPFIIITKKRYVGNLYEEDPSKYSQKSMGIVLKRRDNAPIVKVVCGGIIDKILNERDSIGAVQFTQDTLQDIITGKFHMDKYIITKTFRTGYKDWTRIVQAVLANRMAGRNPGDAPQPNDRIPYVYIETIKKALLQGERVEHPDYVIENKLKLDYLFYITNQIMKPCLQFLELIAENPKEIFNEYIIKEQNRQKGVIPINAYMAESIDNVPNDDKGDGANNDTDDDKDISNLYNFDRLDDKYTLNNINTLNKKKKSVRKKKKIEINNDNDAIIDDNNFYLNI